MKISLSDVEFSSLSILDIGRVFLWDGRIFRAIENASVNDVKNLFECGLIDHLIDRKLFVNSWITDYELDGYGLVVEHEVINVSTYPREWTFSMLKDAAKLIVSLNEHSLVYGYQTKDCHGYNVLFRNSQPVFLDLGSFIKVKTKKDILYSYEEFMKSYYYPLKIWCSGGQYWGVCAAARVGSFISNAAYCKFMFPWFRGVSHVKLDNFLSKLFRLIILDHISLNQVPDKFRALVGLIKKTSILSKEAKFSTLKKKVDRIMLPKERTMWEDYHDEMYSDTEVISNPRFEEIIDRISKLNIDSVLEVAGNQGVFSRMLLERCRSVNKIICTDADGYAVDKGYRIASGLHLNIDWAIFNPFDCESNYSEIAIEKRFSVDAVVALAVTHHLILTQQFTLEYIFDVLSKFTKRYLIIEFMPLGMYDGVTARAVPNWYNEDWFSSCFSKKFTLIECCKLEENRILFIGELKKDS